MKGTFKGSCHCGAIRFACDVDIAPDPPRPWSGDQRYAWTYKCNCSRCTKTRYWKLFVPAKSFRLLTAPNDGALGDYQFGVKMVHHRFCTRCGVAPFASGELEEMGGAFYAVNIAALDDAPAEVLAALPIRYEDGRNDDWDHEPAATRHL